MFGALNMIKDTDLITKREQLEEGEQKEEKKKILKAVEAT